MLLSLVLMLLLPISITIELRFERKKKHLNCKYDRISGKKERHMTGEIKRRSEPPPRWHIKLTPTLISQLRDRTNTSLKRLRVERNAVADTAELRQTENHRP